MMFILLYGIMKKTTKYKYWVHSQKQFYLKSTNDTVLCWQMLRRWKIRLFLIHAKANIAWKQRHIRISLNTKKKKTIKHVNCITMTVLIIILLARVFRMISKHFVYKLIFVHLIFIYLLWEGSLTKSKDTIYQYFTILWYRHRHPIYISHFSYICHPCTEMLLAENAKTFTEKTYIFIFLHFYAPNFAYNVSE